MSSKTSKHKIDWDDFRSCVVGTGHMTYEDSVLCADVSADRGPGRNAGVIIDTYDYGWVVHTYELTAKKLTTLGFSKHFAKVMVAAKKDGYHAVRFDQDGDVYTEFRQFDW
jgi:hypothetical protein